MSTLSPVDPNETFTGMEPLICDAEAIVDALYATLDEQFAKKANDQGLYIVDEQDGSRIFFLVGLAMAMSRKAREAYYVAWENEARKRERNHEPRPH